MRYNSSDVIFNLQLISNKILNGFRMDQSYNSMFAFCFFLSKFNSTL